MSSLDQVVTRHPTRQVRIGAVAVGGFAPVVVQSMTNTDTADADATVAQVSALARAGSELVRITVNSPEAAAQVARIKERLLASDVQVPLVGDFHFNGHRLLTQFPDCAQALDKYRINPGNVGRGARRDEQFAVMIEAACRYGKPVRIGVNWGSLDQDLLARMMDDNAARPTPAPADAVMRDALVTSALDSARRAEELGLAGDRIVLSCKVSGVQDLIKVYRRARRALRLSAAPRAHRSRHGQQRHRRFDRRHGRASAGGHRRHDPRVTHARAGRRPHEGSHRRAGDAADDGAALVHADGDRVSGLRAHDEHVFSGAGGRHSKLAARPDAAMARAAIPVSKP